MQLPHAVWNPLGVKTVFDISAHNPVCDSGHVLAHVVLVDFNDIIDPVCDVCQVPFEHGHHAYTRYQCVASYFLSLPVSYGIIKAEFQKGFAMCQSCAYRHEVVPRGSASL